jgi:hypothetical protein
MELKREDLRCLGRIFRPEEEDDDMAWQWGPHISEGEGKRVYPFGLEKLGCGPTSVLGRKGSRGPFIFFLSFFFFFSVFLFLL